MKSKLKPIEEFSISINKMVEEAVGNIQIWGRATRKDEQSPIDRMMNGFDVTCWQTKQNLTEEECLERAWMELSFFVRFCGQTMDDVSLYGLTPEQEAYIRQQDTCVFEE